MSAACDLFLEVPPLRAAAGYDAYDKLSRAAELWRKEGQHFSAGVAMLDASDAAWGQSDRMLEALRLGIADFEFVISEQAPTSPASLAALYVSPLIAPHDSPMPTAQQSRLGFES